MKNKYSINSWRVVIALAVPLSIALDGESSLAANSPTAAATCGWNIVNSPNSSLPTNVLSDVSVVSANDIWAVGESARGSRVSNPLTEHWNGTTWTIVPAPQPPGSLASLGGVAAFSSTDVWAVGSTQTGTGPLRTFTEHWDGNQWTVVPSPSIGKIGPYPADNLLADVVAIAPNNVWAVGSATTIVAGEALTLHWNGTSWSIVPNPGGNPRFYDANLLGIAALSANDIWAVGQTTMSEEHNMENSPAGDGPTGLAFDGANIWIADAANNDQGTVTKMRASEGVILDTIPFSGLPFWHLSPKRCAESPKTNWVRQWPSASEPFEICLRAPRLMSFK